MKAKPRILATMLAAAVAACLVPCLAIADGGAPHAAKRYVSASIGETQDGAVASGVWGTCPWEIGVDGTLTVHPGTGVNAVGDRWDCKSPWVAYSDNIKRIVLASEGGRKVVAPIDSSGLFSYLESVEAIDLSGLDTSHVENMSGMFYCCAAKSLDLAPLDTSNVTDMRRMFAGCESLASIDLRPLDTSEIGGRQTISTA